DALEIGGRGHLGDSADGDVLVGAVDRAGGGIEGDGGQGIAHVGYGEAQAGQLEGVDVDLEGGGAGAIDLYLGNAIDGAQALGDDGIDQFAQFGHGHGVGGHGELDDGLGVAVGLEDGGIIDTIGQVAVDAAQGIADLRGGGVEIG